MLNTSSLYNSILSSDNHFFQSRIKINGVNYSGSVIKSCSSTYNVFSDEQPAVGRCLSAELDITMVCPTEQIPRMAEVRPYVRVSNGAQTSEWIPQGVFFIDTRKVTHNDDGLDVLTIHCYDAMMKAEADYPSTNHNWPYSDIGVVKEIAKAMGLQSSIYATSGIDSRTLSLMNQGYTIGLPAGYSMREVLSRIAAMYAGNFVMTFDGKLRLIALAELPAETNYLIDESNNAITFGGDRIYV